MTFAEAFEIFNRDYEWWQGRKDVWPTADFLKKYHEGMREDDYLEAEKLLMKTIPALDSLLNDNNFYEKLCRLMGDRDSHANIPAVPNDIKKFVHDQLVIKNHCSKDDITCSYVVLFFGRNLKVANLRAYKFYKALRALFDVVSGLF